MEGTASTPTISAITATSAFQQTDKPKSLKVNQSQTFGTAEQNMKLLESIESVYLFNDMNELNSSTDK
ncbi:unnamed protein product [Didymodactylos carnosus]|uniref:Uncharacterized protein n=1 Tax=Didymodactylos carnosus TaxID=1234261 RepID=A0A814W6I4_9BILA|nr:unnamed protein product [Didymodactylos carnosus]CAF1197326.1 unnamed protein product [Didymodactylos carnosus]CAF3684132.1 unnamed protein product [Didymodactylos carnosus]CAF3961731.1 unnamed protein product [Didymodactylos carnosus]